MVAPLKSVLLKVRFVSFLFHSLRRELEVGILSYSRQRYLQPKPKCSNIASSAYKRIGLTEFWPALTFLLYGIVVSWIVFLLEILNFRSTKEGSIIFNEMKNRVVITIYSNLKRKFKKVYISHTWH